MWICGQTTQWASHIMWSLSDLIVSVVDQSGQIKFYNRKKFAMKFFLFRRVLDSTLSALVGTTLDKTNLTDDGLPEQPKRIWDTGERIIFPEIFSPYISLAFLLTNLLSSEENTITSKFTGPCENSDSGGGTTPLMSL